MKIVNVIGGLGNQLFQYAFAIVLKKHYPNEKIFLDISHFNGYSLHNGFELPNVFGEIEIPIALREDIEEVSRYIPYYKLSRACRKILPKKATEFIEPLYYVYHPEVFCIDGDCYFEGYWQAAPYYMSCKQEIMQQFKFNSINKYSQRMADIIAGVDSVGVHIRRGDYLKDPDYSGICGLDYYKKAIEKISPKNKDWFIFSNDREWCELKILPFIKEANKVYFVDGNKGKESFCDMYLLSKCHSMILANSSFSWWGAFLNENVNRVISPCPWVNRNQEMDIYLPEWEYV